MLVAVVIALAVVVALLAVLVAGLLRSHADILRALHDLGASLDDSPHPGPVRERAASMHGESGMTGRPGATVEGVDVTGAQVAVNITGSRDTLLVFLSSGCGTCQPFWASLRGGAQAPAGTQVLVVTRNPDEESPARIAELGGDTVPVVMSTAAWDDYEIPGSPHVVLVDGGTGTVRGEGAAGSWSAVLDLLGQATGDRRHARSWLPNPGRASAPSPDPVRGSDNPRDNADRIDGELAAHGIAAGHASLWPESR